jgi:hypothetical protein
MLDTWVCHICHKERPDACISVLTYPVKGFTGAEYNVRYCNDNPVCLKKAQEWEKKGKFPR